jgi:CHAD domain-containing protein
MPAVSTRYELLRPRVERLRRSISGVETGDRRAIHRARVASRRLREVLPVLELDPAVTRKLTKRLRKVTRRLGPVREHDVLLLLIDELHESGRSPARALERVATSIREARGAKAASHKAPAKGTIRELHRLGRKLMRLSDELAADRPRPNDRRWRWALEARVARRARSLAAAIADAGAVYLAERLHKVRIAVKKVRYALELMDEAGALKDRTDLRLLKQTQQLLGRLHDLQVLVDRVRQAQAALDPPDVAAWRELDTLVTALEQTCRRLHARYVRERPKLLAACQRMGGRMVASAPSAAARRAG